MVTRIHYTRFERDRLGKLVLRQARYRVIGRPHVLEVGLSMRDAAMVTLASAAWFVVVLVLALNSIECRAPGTFCTQAQVVCWEEQ